MFVTHFVAFAAGLAGLSTAFTVPNSGKSILIFNEFTTGDFGFPAYENSRVNALGFNVTSISTADLATKTVDYLRQFNAIVVGDEGNCNAISRLGFLDGGAAGSADKLAVAVGGNVFVVGTSLTQELSLSRSNGESKADLEDFTKGALEYVASGPSTGLYISLGCYYRFVTGSPTSVAALSGFGYFSARNANNDQGYSCRSDVTFQNSAFAYGAVNAQTLSSWICPIPEVFLDIGPGFLPVASASSAPGTTGTGVIPYILYRPFVVNDCGNSEVQANFGEECDDGPQNGQSTSLCDMNCQCVHGKLPDGSCKLAPNTCGNSEIETYPQPNGNAAEQCDDGPQGSYTCTTVCTCRYGVATSGTCNPVPVCGNGIEEYGEYCDPGVEAMSHVYSPCQNCMCVNGRNQSNGECNAVVGVCGNGVWENNTADLEECDEGPEGNYFCGSDCKCIYGTAQPGACTVPSVCGDGVVGEGEQCEPRNPNPPRDLNGRADLNSLFARRPTPVADGICSEECQCIFGLDENNECRTEAAETTTTSDSTATDTTSPSSTSSTTSAPTSSRTSSRTSSVPSSTPAGSSPAAPSPATSSPIQSNQPTIISPSSVSSQPPTIISSTIANPSAISGPFPERVNRDFLFLGCTGSENNYPSFSLQTSAEDMDLELCTAACSGRLYAGVHVTDCYCADTFDNVVTVARDLCSVPCPGDPSENCGGYRANSTTVFSRRKRQQAGIVPSNALLAIYIYDPIVPPASTAPPPVPAPSGPSSLGPAPVPGSQTRAASTATAVVTEVVTATAGAGAGGAGCATGYCHGAGYVFEQCVGGPRPREAVFVIRACSCAGGWQYVPAGCSGDACGSQVVYRIVPWTGAGAGDVTVWKPQACSGEGCVVTFQQDSGNGGGADNGGKGWSSSSSGNSTAGEASSTQVVVVAGASKVAASLMVGAGVVGLLLL